MAVPLSGLYTPIFKSFTKHLLSFLPPHSFLVLSLFFFPLSSCVHPLINAAYISMSYLMHWGLWGVHNAFVGNIKNIVCCSYPQEFATWEDMIYMCVKC